MPKVDPDTGQPLSDDPDGPDELRGGKKIGDPDLADATPTGGSRGPGQPSGQSAGARRSNELPGDAPSAKQ